MKYYEKYTSKVLWELGFRLTIRCAVSLIFLTSSTIWNVWSDFLWLLVIGVHIFRREYNIRVDSVLLNGQMYPHTHSHTHWRMYLWLLEHIKWSGWILDPHWQTQTCWMLCKSVTSRWCFSGRCNLLEKNWSHKCLSCFGQVPAILCLHKTAFSSSSVIH